MKGICKEQYGIDPQFMTHCTKRSTYIVQNVRTGNHIPTCGIEKDMRERQHTGFLYVRLRGKGKGRKALRTHFGLNPLLAANLTRPVRRLTYESAGAASGWQICGDQCLWR